MTSEALGAGSQSIKSPPLGQVIANRLRGEILRGQLLEGEQVVQTKVAERFGTSRIPVREALQMLELEGLLVRDQSNHCMVSRFDATHIRENYRVRALLEGEAAALCARQPIDVEELMRIQAAIEGCDAHADQYADELIDLVSDFHRWIWVNAGNSILAKLAEQQWSMTAPQARSLVPGQSVMSSDAHQQVITAIRGGDADAAREAMSRHILEAGDAYLEFRSPAQEVSST